ncbi:MAG: metallophosphoesterase [Candidatus Thermoplasmatota archaeon]
MIDFDEVISILRKDKPLLKLNGNFIVVGDTHGDFETSKKIFELYRNEKKFLFLGDYVDRGEKQIENIDYLLSMKIQYPDKLFLLRGNHELSSVNSYYGFQQEVENKYSFSIYEKYNECFSYLPLAGIINDKIFCVHGGIAKGIKNIEEIEKIERNEENELFLQLLWNDPDESISGFKFNWKRGGFYIYGKDVFNEFMDKNKLEKCIRAHEVFPEGHNYFFDKRLLSIFSAKKYGYARINGKIAVVKGNEIEIARAP